MATKTNNLESYVDMMDTYMEQKVRTIRALASTKNTPVLVGAPGVGKSALIRAMGKAEGRTVITIIGSRMDPTDVSGLPFPRKERNTNDEGEHIELHVTEFLTPAWQARILREKKVILFFDEFSNTPPAVQASMLTILQERELPNGFKLPNDTYIIAAMNPADSAVDYGGISKPTANRMAWISWNPTAESWYKGMLNAWGKEDASEAEMKWRKHIVAFIKQDRQFLHKEPDEVANQGNSKMFTYLDKEDSSDMTVFENAYPTRRTWDKLSEALPAAEGDSGIENQLMISLVGYEAGVAFADYLARQVKVDPEDVIKDPSIVPWADGSPDDANVIIRALVKKIDKNETDIDRIDAIMGVFDYIVKEAERGDLAAFAIMDIVKNCPSRTDIQARVIKTFRLYSPFMGENKRKKVKRKA